MKTINQKGEGIVQTLIILIVLGGLGFAGYVYLWPMVSGSDKPAPQAVSAEATPPPGETNGKAGGMAAAAVQAGQAAGDLYSSGR